MSAKTISFTCINGVCTPSKLSEKIGLGDVLNFTNNITTAQVVLSGFSPDLFDSEDTSITIDASSTQSETIATDVDPDTYIYTITCDTCPGGNDQPEIIVVKN
jgi:hypothetical protein